MSPLPQPICLLSPDNQSHDMARGNKSPGHVSLRSLSCNRICSWASLPPPPITTNAPLFLSTHLYTSYNYLPSLSALLCCPLLIFHGTSHICIVSLGTLIHFNIYTPSVERKKNHNNYINPRDCLWIDSYVYSQQPITGLRREFPRRRLRPRFDAEGTLRAVPPPLPLAALGKDGWQNIAPCASAKCSV